MIVKILLIVCLTLATLQGNALNTTRRDFPIPYRESNTQPLSKIDAIYNDLVTRRSLQIARLRAYAAAGRFPRNRDFPGQLVPYFVDTSNTACAVAHLMRLDGETSTVNSIAATDNHIRIENAARGPLLDWIRNSGLTLQECALIQPSYAKIEDYRRHPQWRDEQQRLRTHFESVEKTLHVQTQRSLGEALIANLDAERKSATENSTNEVATLIAALASPERNIRIAAAHLLSNLSPEQAARTPRINALNPNLQDPDLAVAFWTAVAVENVGSAGRWDNDQNPGAVELHLATLPVFLSTFRSDFGELRLPALIQLANIAPDSINTNRQLRILPDIRHALVAACDDRDSEIRSAARRVLETWRWQRTAYESQRMRRHYLADSYDLECLASETITLGRSFATPSVAVDKLRQRMSIFDNTGGVHFFEPRPNLSLPNAATTFVDASQLVQQNLRSLQQESSETDPPNRKAEQVANDPLYFGVKIVYPDDRYPHSSTYLVPRPALFEVFQKQPHSWLETQHGSPHPNWPAAPASTIRPAENLRVRLASNVRNDLERFTAACDLSASFMTFYARIILDRTTSESPDSFVWIGRIADLRQYQPRFLEQGGGGSSVYGGGGWDFHQLTMKCDRSTGHLHIAVEPIEYALKPPATEVVAPAWTVAELKLMGWKPLQSPDFFGDRLLPPEYLEAAAEFDAEVSGQSKSKSFSKLYRTWSQDKSLPFPGLMYALLYERAGDRESALQSVRSHSGSIDRDPAALADIARWELSVGETDSARKHAEAALKLWPNHHASVAILKQIADAHVHR